MRYSCIADAGQRAAADGDGSFDPVVVRLLFNHFIRLLMSSCVFDDESI